VTRRDDMPEPDESPQLPLPAPQGEAEAGALRDADLVARALDALPATERARIDASLESDAALRARFETIAAHLLAYDQLPPAPPPPAFARIAAALDETTLGDEAAPDLDVLRLQTPRPARQARWPLVAAAAAVLLALLLWRPWQVQEAGRLTIVPGRGIELVRAGAALPAPALATRHVQPGDVLRCRAPAEVRLDDRVRLVLDAGSRVRLESAAAVTLEAGRAWFEVEPGAFEVRTAHGPVRVLGTAFEVDVRAGALEVAVAHGRVAAGGHEIGAGLRLASGRVAAAPFAAGAWFQRPRMRVEAGPARLGAPLRLTLVLENPGQVPVALRGPSDARFALWLHFEDADGRAIRELPVLATNITAGADLLAPGVEHTLEPGSRKAITIEIPAPFTSPGTYLCRALYRPAGRPGVLSDARRLEVR